jgi:hypothetical protein
LRRALPPALGGRWRPPSVFAFGSVLRFVSSREDISSRGAAEDSPLDPLGHLLAGDLGEPVEDFVEPLSDDEVAAYHECLDEAEPAHAAAAARLHTLFAG